MTDNSLEPWRRRSDIDGTRDEFHLELEALRASRARMVAAADAERRWIERELHDGVQQHLVALAVNVQLVRQLAGSDFAAAMALLEEIRSDVREALDGVRTLANEIYPPLLLDSGLAEALRAATSANAAPKRVDAAALGRYPPAVEATAYFCCLEALRSAAARVTVRAWEEDGALHFEVLSEGFVTGQDADDLGDRAERVEALGGWLTVSFEPGPARRVSGAIPLSP